jgi:hypothetical protein
MHGVFGMNYFVFCFLVLALVLFFTKEIRDEGFYGMSPGTLDQLRSTSIPSFSSLPPMSTSMMNPQSTPLNTIIQDNLTKKGIMDMTEVSPQQPGFYALI